jgi:hypothetical protein
VKFGGSFGLGSWPDSKVEQNSGGFTGPGGRSGWHRGGQRADLTGSRCCVSLSKEELTGERGWLVDEGEVGGSYLDGAWMR